MLTVVTLFISVLIEVGFSPSPIITRHDVDDDEYIELGLSVRGLVHLNLPDGEGVLISSEWVCTSSQETRSPSLAAGDIGTGQTGPTGNDGRVRAATNRVDEASDLWLRWKFDDPEAEGSRATPLEGISGPGDSGGPAYYQDGDVTYVMGISSGQSTRATGGREGFYGVTEFYTRVSSYTDWIGATMGTE